jgi:hypothetical protein
MKFGQLTFLTAVTSHARVDATGARYDSGCVGDN